MKSIVLFFLVLLIVNTITFLIDYAKGEHKRWSKGESFAESGLIIVMAFLFAWYFS